MRSRFVEQIFLQPNEFHSFQNLEFSAFLKFHNDLRRKYADLRTYSEQMDRYVEQYRTELARKDKKIQSQSSQILRFKLNIINVVMNV